MIKGRAHPLCLSWLGSRDDPPGQQRSRKWQLLAEGRACRGTQHGGKEGWPCRGHIVASTAANFSEMLL